MASGFFQLAAAIAPKGWQRRVIPTLRAGVQSLQTLPIRRLKAQSGWFVATLIYTVLLAWQGRWVVSTTAGLSMAISIFQVQQGYWRLPRLPWRRWLDGQHHPLAAAGWGGAIATLGTFLALASWQDSPSPGWALGWLLQGGLLSFIGVRLLMEMGRSGPPAMAPASPSAPAVSVWETLTADFTHPSVIKRYAAVRRLLWPEVSDQLAALDREQEAINIRTYLCDCLQLMAEQEPHPLVRRAIADTLQGLSLQQPQPIRPTHQLGTGMDALTFPQPAAISSPHLMPLSMAAVAEVAAIANPQPRYHPNPGSQAKINY